VELTAINILCSYEVIFKSPLYAIYFVCSLSFSEHTYPLQIFRLSFSPLLFPCRILLTYLFLCFTGQKKRNSIWSKKFIFNLSIVPLRASIFKQHCFQLNLRPIRLMYKFLTEPVRKLVLDRLQYWSGILQPSSSSLLLLLLFLLLISHIHVYRQRLALIQPVRAPKSLATKHNVDTQ
jgi:hypothetical protein